MKRQSLIVLGCLIVVVLGLAFFYAYPDLLRNAADPQVIKKFVADMGAFGPVILVMLMTVAVVFTPIPSAPIAMAAGAIFGHIVGAIYVIIGAELGALLAFTIARTLGRDLLRKWLGSSVDSGLLGSQNTLMFAVFISRLMPFVSFDLMSYAAGLSALKFWRFAIATLAGIIPASLFLTHFGGVLAQTGGSNGVWAALAFGGITGLPLIYLAIKSRRNVPKVMNEKGPPF
jgi:LPXTG-motif cell wall-anchored protein